MKSHAQIIDEAKKIAYANNSKGLGERQEILLEEIISLTHAQTINDVQEKIVKTELFFRQGCNNNLQSFSGWQKCGTDEIHKELSIKKDRIRYCEECNARIGVFTLLKKEISEVKG